MGFEPLLSSPWMLSYNKDHCSSRASGAGGHENPQLVTPNRPGEWLVD